MVRKTRILALMLGGACCFGVSKASAQYLLPGNVWPNSDLSTAAPAGVDQIYGPNAAGDSNPRPDGWHRGNSDFAVQTAPNFTFYNTPGNSAGEGTAPAGSHNGYALEINDTSQAGVGEWFSDLNALPASVLSNPSETFYLSYWLQYTNVHSSQLPENSDQFRVSVVWANTTSPLTSPPYENVTTGPDNIIPAGSPDVTQWTQVIEPLNLVTDGAPVGTGAMRITIDSGGSNAATGQIWVEGISLSDQVPEPASIAVLSGATMLLCSRRRRA